ncbi:hypothetical protein EDB92DRAFT_176648 [Lactarius akahatsu]|uniref:Uncharacterized protein n=1 Tax=Lactarius akahatsu TaxID=416441 RepID=A0AAD4L5W1_9AGAM|nr:hypothetical protein EDB92DRAFT_176648 [Lactarius akahatsu]
MNLLQKKIAHLDTENHTSRKRMKELEHELDVCRQDVERQRTLVAQRTGTALESLIRLLPLFDHTWQDSRPNSQRIKHYSTNCVLSEKLLSEKQTRALFGRRCTRSTCSGKRTLARRQARKETSTIPD